MQFVLDIRILCEQRLAKHSLADGAVRPKIRRDACEHESDNQEPTVSSRFHSDSQLYSACLFRRTNSSRLNGKFADAASSSAPPAAEKTDESRGAFTPKAIVIVSAKMVRRTPLNKAMV